MTSGTSYSTHAVEDEEFALNSDGFNLKEGWTNEDTDEETFALLSPEVYDGTWKTAKGATFTWDGGSASFNGSDPIKIPVDKLGSVKFQAPPNASGSFQIKVEALTVDTDPDTGSTVEAISGEAWLTNLVVKPVADKVTLGISQAQGDEDTQIPLDVRPTSNDADESFTVTISEIPAGARIFYDGAEKTVSGGSVEIENYEAGKLQIEPPLNSSDDFTLKISAMAVDEVTLADGNTVVTSDPVTPTELDLAVKVKGVADVADITIHTSGSSVTEEATDNADGKISLQGAFSVSLTDDDNSETASLVITGLGDDFSLEGGSFLGGTGSGRQWLVSPDDVNNGNVSVVADKNFNGKINFMVNAVTTEGDGNAKENADSEPVTLTVTPSPEADMHNGVDGKEDTSVKLDFGVEYHNGDVDEYISSVWVNKNDADAKGITFSGGGVTEETIDGVPYYKVNELDNLSAKGPANEDGDITFGVKYEVTDPGNNDVADGTVIKDATYTLHLDPVTDETATALGDNFTNTDSKATFNENTNTVTATGETEFSFDVTVTQQADSNATGGTADTDGSEKLQYFIVDGVPAGLSIEGGSYMGHNPGGGADDFTGRWMVPAEDTDFDNASVTKTLNFTLDNSAGAFNENTTYDLTITAYSKDGTALTQETSSADWHLATEVTGSGTPYNPATVAVAARDFTAIEDTAFRLDDMLNFTMNDAATNPDPHPKFSIVLSGLPEGTEVEGMTRDGDVWTASGTGGQSELASLANSITITPPENWNGNVNNVGNGNFHLDVKVTAYTDGGETNVAELENAAPTAFTPRTDEIGMTINANGANEGSDVEITIDLANAADGKNANVVDGKLYLQIEEPAQGTGGILHYGGSEITATNVTGVAGITDGAYFVVEGLGVSGAGGAGSVSLSYSPETHASGDITIRASVVSRETGAANIQTSTVNKTVTISPINSGYNVQGITAQGDEDTRVQLQITGDGLVDQDGSESIIAAKLTGVPDGYLVFVGSDESSASAASNVGSETWSIPLNSNELPAYIAVQAPENESGEATVTLSVFSGEQGQTLTETTQDLRVTMSPSTSIRPWWIPMVLKPPR